MNVFDFPDMSPSEEITDVLFDNGGVRIEKISSLRSTTGWYDQNEDEWVCLLEGEADIEFEGGIKTLKKGDSILIRKHERHRVARTTRCIWLCVFMEEKDESNE
jgi:cupin 2 domain-containing protein